MKNAIPMVKKRVSRRTHIQLEQQYCFYNIKDQSKDDKNKFNVSRTYVNYIHLYFMHYGTYYFN